MVVDDDADLRDLVRLRFSAATQLQVVGMAADGREAITIARRLQPDAMTLDLDMPNLGGAEAIPLLRIAAPRMRIVVYSGHADAPALTNGSRPDGLVRKAQGLGDLVAAVLRVLGAMTPGPASAPVSWPVA